MNACSPLVAMLAGVLCLGGSGCRSAPGRPRLDAEAVRPSQVVRFETLYGENCAGCHGERGRGGAALSLANPVYLSTAGIDTLRRITAAGVPGTLMPAFARGSGGMLTDAQIDVLARGMVQAWGNPHAVAGVSLLPYASSAPGVAARGQIAFTTFCASCHGADGAGTTNHGGQRGSIVDPAYLALVSDQGLRSVLIAGDPEHGMLDWRSDLPKPEARAMTDEEVTDVVAWMASLRTPTPGQPYPQHP